MYNDRAHEKFRNKPIQEVFNEIYKENHWNDSESKSGTGSNSIQTEEVKSILRQVVHQLNCKTMLDVPCGDFNWMKDVDIGICKYLGADIVNELVDGNIARYGSLQREFFYADITTTALPKVDLIFCRDCLVHLSYENIGRAISNIKRSESTYLLTTTFSAHPNRDIVTGNWRPINLDKPPFLFPSPDKLFSEKCTESDNRYEDKSLALWRIENLP